MNGTSSAGRLFVFDVTSRLIAFEYGTNQSTDSVEGRYYVIALGGMKDVLLTPAYFADVSKQLPKPWILVQPMLSSSGVNYGTSRLQTDVTELDKLMEYLNPRGVVLLGHSTGAQVSVLYAKHGMYREKILGVTLQAGVSDREWAEATEGKEVIGERLKLAKEMIEEGLGDLLVPRIREGTRWSVPMTAHRFCDLHARLGEDDMFSSDLSEAELLGKLGHLQKTRVLLAFSMQDQYVPEYVDKDALLENMSNAMGKKNVTVVKVKGNHSLNNNSEEFLNALNVWIGTLLD